MSRRRPLPPELALAPFRVRDAAAVIPRSRLRGLDLNADVHGTRMVSRRLTLEQRCLLLQERIPGAFFSHVTAALLWRIPIPWMLDEDLPVDVSLHHPRRAPHAADIRGHQLRLVEPHVRVLPSGVRVTSPARTWVDLSSMLKVIDLVAVADYAIHWRHPIATRAQLSSMLEQSGVRRGSAKLREALSLANDRSESAQESRLRVIIHYGGLPAPKVNHVVEDRFGEFVARADLLFEEYNFVLEYMGDYHRTTTGQWRADMTRRSRLEAGGRGVMELNADDLKDPDELIQRIRARISIHVQGQ